MILSTQSVIKTAPAQIGMLKRKLAYRMGSVFAGILLAGAVFGQSVSVDVSVSAEASVEAHTSDTSAACIVAGHRVFDPGFSLVPSTGVWFADEPTDISCYGTIAGMQLAGPAEIDLGGTYGQPSLLSPFGDTCLAGRMVGDVAVRLQTKNDGILEFTGLLEFIRNGLQLTAQGVLSGPVDLEAHALIVATPDPGQDCTTVPITGVNIVATAQIRAAE